MSRQAFKIRSCDPMMRFVCGFLLLAGIYLIFVSLINQNQADYKKLNIKSNLPPRSPAPLELHPSQAPPIDSTSNIFSGEAIKNDKETFHLNKFEPIVDAKDIQLMEEETRESLVMEVRNKWLKAPSTLPYNYTLVPNNFTAIKKMHKRILEIFNYKKYGIFIESGGFDGVTLSNTLHLEVDYNWRGLLVEADPNYFSRMEVVHRKAWIINACFGLEQIPQKVRMTRIKDQGALSSINEVAPAWFRKEKQAEEFEAQCFPFTTILAAAGLAGEEELMVDYWSLDIEGAELKVLKTIPWDFVYIKVINIEVSAKSSVLITNFLELRNFVLIETFHGAYIHDNLYINKRFMREIMERE